LFNANNQPTDIFLVTAEHNTGPVEVDVFEQTRALVGLRLPNGTLANAILGGPALVEVDLASLKDANSSGAAGPNGREEVDTELMRMELTGATALGPLTLRAGRAYGLPASNGQIEEQDNILAGRLDLPGPDAPFCTPPTPLDCVGAQADSFFDVFFEVEVPGIGKLHNRDALRIESVISQKPPKARYIHVITDPIQLFNANNQPTDIYLVTAEHNTSPVEVDIFERTQALVGIRLANGSLVNAVLSGPATVEVDLGSLNDNSDEAASPGGAPSGPEGPNGLEEVDTELVSMQLAGSGLTLRAGRGFGLPASHGQIEEQANILLNRLDLPGPDAPFCTPPTPADCAGAKANSFFDVFFEVDVPGVGTLYNKEPLRIQTVIDKKNRLWRATST
jgi:hypothetical protein